MTSRPNFLKNNKKKVCLICEGYEEFDYISKLLELNVWSNVYDFSLGDIVKCCGLKFGSAKV